MRALLVFLLMSGSAYAHSWYDPDCCDTRDCREAAVDEVEELADGYHVWGIVVPYGDKKIRGSADKNFHVCGYPRSKHLVCLYVPGRGV